MHTYKRPRKRVMLNMSRNGGERREKEVAETMETSQNGLQRRTVDLCPMTLRYSRIGMSIIGHWDIGVYPHYFIGSFRYLLPSRKLVYVLYGSAQKA